MPSIAWTTPQKALEYYLEAKKRTAADLWHAAYGGQVRVRIMGEDFAPPQVRALLDLARSFGPTDSAPLELPLWMSVSVDDIERVLCGAALPAKRRGRPPRTRGQTAADYRIAVAMAKLITSRKAKSVNEAARIVVERGDVPGLSYDARMKKAHRAYASAFRPD